MSYDFDYYSGNTLRVPVKPIKPRLERNPSAIEARSFADALEDYEHEIKSYNEDLGWHRAEKSKLIAKFKEMVRSDYGLCQSEFDVIWDEANRRKSSEGLQGVYYEFESLFDFIKEYMKSMKSVS